MQFEAKVIWHQPHEQDGKVAFWQNKLYGAHEGHGAVLEIITREETFDKSATYVVTINESGESAPELRNPVGVALEAAAAVVKRVARPTLKPKAKKAAAKKR